MSKYRKELKWIAVRQYLKSADSPESIANQLEIDSTSVRLWIRHYEQNAMAAFEKKYSHYSAQFKLSVLRYIQVH
jgi:transposase